MRLKFLARYCDADGPAEMRPHPALLTRGERLPRLRLEDLTPEATCARLLAEGPKNVLDACPAK